MLSAGATAYRMGGDEFCVVARSGAADLLNRGAAALSEDGDAFQIGGSYGSAKLGGGARSVDEALAELRRCAGTQFDPRIVEVFTSVAVAEFQAAKR